MKVLGNSKMDVSRPKDFDKSLKQYLAAIGLKNHEDLYRDTVCVTVVNKDGMIIFFPSRNGGIKGGFAILPKDKIEVSEKGDSSTIARALLDAFEKSI